jgi:hypothetical protein
MASAWGKAWGAAFANAWGALQLVAPSTTAGGASKKPRLRPFRPMQVPALAWDSDEDEAALLVIGAL